MRVRSDRDIGSSERKSGQLWVVRGTSVTDRVPLSLIECNQSAVSRLHPPFENVHNYTLQQCPVYSFVCEAYNRNSSWLILALHQVMRKPPAPVSPSENTDVVTTAPPAPVKTVAAAAPANLLRTAEAKPKPAAPSLLAGMHRMPDGSYVRNPAATKTKKVLVPPPNPPAKAKVPTAKPLNVDADADAAFALAASKVVHTVPDYTKKPTVQANAVLQNALATNAMHAVEAPKKHAKVEAPKDPLDKVDLKVVDPGITHQGELDAPVCAALCCSVLDSDRSSAEVGVDVRSGGGRQVWTQAKSDGSLRWCRSHRPIRSPPSALSSRRRRRRRLPS